MLVREQNRRHKSLMVSLQEDFNNFIMKVENAEESLSLDIIIKAPEGIILIDYFKWVILTSNDTSCSIMTEMFHKNSLQNLGKFFKTVVTWS